MSRKKSKVGSLWYVDRGKNKQCRLPARDRES